jgi:TatD DNase family protein
MDAYIDVLEILAPYKGQIRGKVHFFVGDLDIARRFLDLDFTLSFTGVITFARDYDQVIRETPLEMIQSETDSPFAAPIPFRGGRAEPSHVREVIGQIAALKGSTVSEVENTLLATAHRVFRTH